MDHRGVGLEEGARVLHVGEFNTGPEQMAPLFRGELAVIRVVLPLPPLAGEVREFEVRPQRRLFVPALFRPFPYLRHLLHSS